MGDIFFSHLFTFFFLFLTARVVEESLHDAQPVPREASDGGELLPAPDGGGGRAT